MSFSSIFRCFPLPFFVIFFALSARAEISVNITYLDPAGTGFYDSTPRAAVAGNSGTTLGQQRRNAFEAAVYHWSKLLNGTVPVNIRATWTSQGTVTLASARPLDFYRDWNGVPVAGRFYPAALANELAGYDIDPNTDEIQVTCNPDWDNGANSGKGDFREWYYGLDGEPAFGDFDFYATMLHELGHGFGFSSFLNTDGSWVLGNPTIYDNFLVNSSGMWLTSLSQSQRAAMVTSENLFSAGNTTTSVHYDQWAKIHAPSSFVSGSSLSHLDETTYSDPGSIDECMTPVASFATHNIGPVATAILRDLGYSFVDNQAPSVTISEPADGSSRLGITKVSGSAKDNSSTGDAGATGLREVRVTLWRQAGGNWFNWLANAWDSTTFDPHLHIKLAKADIVPIGKGTRNWSLNLPTLADGNYEIQVQAVDQMNIGSAWVKSAFKSRSVPDTTLPEIAIISPATNAVITSQVLPNISGTAFDPETGIGSVTLYLLRFAENGVLFWDGVAWGENSANIAASYDSTTQTWQSTGTLPSGSNLPNGNYQVQVSVQNGETPPGTRGLGANFSVDFHPTYTWTQKSFTDGVSGNDNYNWDNPANWNPYGVPPSDAIAVINSGTCDATASGSISIYGVNIGGSGTLTTPGLFVKKLNISGGTLNGGAVNVDGNGGVLNWSGGQINGTFGILAGATANLTGNSSKALGPNATFNNGGTVNWSGTGVINNFAYNAVERATFNNLSNAVFNVQNDGDIFVSYYNRSTFNNSKGARFIKTGGTGNTGADGFDFNNSGEIRAEVGNLNFGTFLNASDESVFSGSGQVQMLSGTLNLSGRILFDSIYFKMQSGSLSGSPDLVLTTTNNAVFEWAGGSISGTLDLSPNSVFQIAGNSTKSLGSAAVVRNRGTITWSGAGDINAFAYNLSDRAVFQNLNGATFTVTGSGNFVAYYNPSIFNNEAGATVLKSGGAMNAFNWDFNNNGVVQSFTGGFSFNSGGDGAGSFFAGNGTIVKFNGGTRILEAGTRLYGPGTFQISGGTVTRNGVLEVGTVSVPTTLELFGSATLDGAGELAGNCLFNWSNGTVGGQLDIGTNITINAISTSRKTFANGAVINNRGAFNWNAGDLHTIAYNLSDRAIFNNLSNAIFTISGEGYFSHTYNPSIFNNEVGATVVKLTSTGQIQFDWIFNNAGTVRSSSGTLSFSGGGSSSGSFTADSGAVIKFSGGTHNLAHDTILNGGGKFQIIGSTVNHNGDIETGTAETPATLEIFPGGIFSGSGALNGVATLNWTGGQIGSGKLDLAPTITVNASGSSRKNLAEATIFNNAGVFNLSGGTIYCMAYEPTNRSVINNLSNAVFDVQGDLYVFDIAYNASTFANHPGAVFRKSSGTNASTVGWFDFVNAGELQVQSGALNFGSNLDLNPGSIFTGSGIVRLSGTTTLATNLNSSAHLILQSGSFLGKTDAASVPTFSGFGKFEWQGGTIGGALTIASGTQFDVTGSNRKNLSSGTIFNNEGTVNWSSTGDLYASAYLMTDRVTVNNRGIWNLTSDARFDYAYNPSTFNNEPGATFRKSGTTGITTCYWHFNNRGALDIATGKLFANSPVSISAEALMKFTLSGTEPLTDYGQFSNSGTLALNGNLEIALADDFIPTNGTSFQLMTYTARTGAFSSVLLPELPRESEWRITYGTKALTADVVAKTMLGNFSRLGDGSFQFSVAGAASSAAIVESSSDLISWIPIATNSPFNGTWDFVDPQAVNSTNRFYRARILE